MASMQALVSRMRRSASAYTSRSTISEREGAKRCAADPGHAALGYQRRYGANARSSTMITRGEGAGA